MKQIVLMDLDETLLDFRLAERRSLAGALQAMNLPREDRILELYSRLNRECWLRLEQGTLSRPALRTERFRLLGEALGCDREPAEMAEAYESRLAAAGYLLPGAKETMDALRGKYRLYAVTNGFARTQHGRLAASGLGEYFDDVFISQELGADKPSKAYFDAVFSRIPGFTRENAVLLGDSLTSDIAGGRAAGLTTVWLSDAGTAPDTCLPDYTIRKITEFPVLLSRL